jgi:hypothetical protein
MATGEYAVYDTEGKQVSKGIIDDDGQFDPPAQAKEGQYIWVLYDEESIGPVRCSHDAEYNHVVTS